MFWLRRWLPEVSRDHAGLAMVSAAEWRWARRLTWLATLWFCALACWGLFGPHLAGHYASTASVGIIADNMLKWRIAGPVWSYSATEPALSQYYCHHPWGIFWTQAGFHALLGRHDFVARLPPILASVATVPLLYKLGSALWRPLAGALAACAFVVLPISLSFAHFNALEVPVMLWSTLGLWGFVRYRQCGSKRHLAASLVGMWLAMNADWPGFMLMALLLATVLVSLFLQKQRSPRRERRLLRWWVLGASLAVLTGVGYLLLFQRSGKLLDLTRSYGLRSHGQELPLIAVLKSRSYWIALMFTPLATALGKLAALWLVLRSLLRRRIELPLLVLAMATVQYVVFKQGADVHIFWPHYFALYFALAIGALSAGFIILLSKTNRSPMWAALWLLPLAAILRDGVEVASYARASGGRFNEHGNYITSDGDKTALLTHVAAQLSDGEAATLQQASVDLHPSMHPTWSQVWTLGGRVVNTAANRPAKAAFIADARYVDDARLRAWLRHGTPTVVGPFWWFNAGEAPPAMQLQAIPRGMAARYLRGSHEPDWLLKPDPLHAWEVRHHFGLETAAPTASPKTVEQLRVTHNIAMVAGDAVAAQHRRHQLMRHYEPMDHAFDGGPRLIGSRFEPGERPQLWLLFEARGPLGKGLRPAVRSRVVTPPAWSLSPADPTLREVGAPLALKATGWRNGLLYSYRVTIRKRPGEEVFELYWRYGGGPRATSPALSSERGGPFVEVLRQGT